MFQVRKNLTEHQAQNMLVTDLQAPVVSRKEVEAQVPKREVILGVTQMLGVKVAVQHEAVAAVSLKRMPLSR